MRKFLILWATVLAPALAWAGAPQTISVQKPWLRYLLPSLPAGGYMVLSNSGDLPESLSGASSPACGSLMLHESMNMGGTAMMMQVETVPIPAHGQAELVEGGYHLMCMQPKMKLGETVPITLTFADGTSLTVQAPVYGASGAP
jgi:periplasmic copper chaperone A